VTKEKISEYDPSADGNTDVNGVNIAEGCAPSGINNAIREVMAALKRFETGSDGDSITVGGNLVVSGTANVSGASTFSGATTFSSSVVISGATTATTVSATVIQSDTINEKTSAAGVTIDGVLLKDTTVTANTVKASGTSSSQGEVQFFEDTDNGTNYVALKAPASVASNVTWTLPNADGTADQVLKTDGSGNLGWAASGGSAEIGTLQQFYKSDYITPDATFPDSTWLKADGSVVSQATYTDLFDKVGLQPDGLYNFENRLVIASQLYIYKIIYGDSLWVAAGNGGVLYTSTDAITWTSRTSGVTTFIYDLIYGNSLYVYGADAGVIRTSTDGITWTARTSGSATTTYISALTFGDNLYVYGNNIGAIRSSTNGITWTARTSGTTFRIGALAYGNGVFVYGDYNGNIRTSTDAITWDARTSGLPAGDFVTSMIYGDGIFVAGAGVTSKLLTSTDGVTWTKVAEGFPGAIYSLAYDDGIYLLQSNFAPYSSTDAVNWTQINQLESGQANGGYGVGVGDGMFVHGGPYSIFSAPKYSYNTATEFALPRALGRAEDEQLAVYIKATT
jgi:hypothetical protein